MFPYGSFGSNSSHATDNVIVMSLAVLQYCGSTIAGLSLLSAAVMRLTHDKDKTHFADILLPRRSLYIMQ